MKAEKTSPDPALRLPALCCCCLLPLVAIAGPPERDDTAREILGRALGPTPILTDLEELADGIGGRPTGSPALVHAVEWGVRKLREAGLETVHTEPFTVALLWLPGGESGEITAPEERALRVVALPFSAATGPKGIEAEVVDVHQGDEADFAAKKEKLRGRWALVSTDPMRTIDDLDNEYRIAPDIFAAARRAGTVGVLWMSTHPGRLLYRHPIRLNDTVDALPGAMIEREEALRIGRILATGKAVRVRIISTSRVVNDFASANVVAEVRGDERPEEFVILGAHLDSWDLGQGALDNGCNSALVIDAARQIAAVAKTHRPKRTIRFVLFTGEEDGFLGSFADARLHRADLDRTVAMITFDLGTGRTTGFSTGGRADLLDAVTAALAPAAGLGPFTQTTDAFIGTDNYDYLVEGVPTFVANQDDVPYLPNYHASSDTYDKIDARELQANTAIAAVFAWQLANSQTPPGRRQTRNEIVDLLKATSLDQKMKVFGLWDDFVSGKRGRAPL